MRSRVAEATAQSVDGGLGGGQPGSRRVGQVTLISECDGNQWMRADPDQAKCRSGCLARQQRFAPPEQAIRQHGRAGQPSVAGARGEVEWF